MGFCASGNNLILRPFIGPYFLMVADYPTLGSIPIFPPSREPRPDGSFGLPTGGARRCGSRQPRPVAGRSVCRILSHSNGSATLRIRWLTIRKSASASLAGMSLAPSPRSEIAVHCMPEVKGESSCQRPADLTTSYCIWTFSSRVSKNARCLSLVLYLTKSQRDVLVKTFSGLKARIHVLQFQRSCATSVPRRSAE